MNIEINSKYNIGDILQIHRKVGVYDREIKCPLCKGKYKGTPQCVDEDTIALKVDAYE